MKFLNLQVSNGLEILLSMGNRLTLNIRSESAYGIGEVLKRFTKRPSGRVSFSFTRGYSGARKSCRRPQTPACIPTRSAPVAYAPSLAHTSFRPEYFDKEELSRLLAPFYAISVREQETVNLFQPLVNKRIEICADPTLLLDATSYEPLLQGARQKMEESYLFVYMLRSCPELVESASRVAELLGVKVFYVSEEALDIANSENLFGIGPEEFLWLIKNATGVLTNSFHATLFSVIFHTPFRTFASDLSSSRVRGFLKDLGIDQCLSTKTDIRPLTIVDWSESDKSVIGMRERSWDFLKGALA